MQLSNKQKQDLLGSIYLAQSCLQTCLDVLKEEKNLDITSSDAD